MSKVQVEICIVCPTISSHSFVLCQLALLFRRYRYLKNKANLRDLIAATDPVILFKLDLNRRFFDRVTLKFDGWPQEITRHVFYTTSSFLYHFRSISEFKLELAPWNVQSGSNSMIFLAVWPCNLTYDLAYDLATSSFVHHFVAIGDFKLEIQSGNVHLGLNRWFLEPCDLAISRMTLKNNSAPLLCYFKLCASFPSHWWIQTGVTVRKCTIWVKFNNF